MTTSQFSDAISHAIASLQNERTCYLARLRDLNREIAGHQRLLSQLPSPTTPNKVTTPNIQ